MTNTLLSNRRNTRENLLMFFYSKEFMNSEKTISDHETKRFLDSINEIKREDKLENIRETIKEVFDNIKITKLETGDLIEFQVPYIKDKITLTFGEMDSLNGYDGFLSKATELLRKYKISDEWNTEEESSFNNIENLKFFRLYIESYFFNISTIDEDIKKNLENWDFGRISIVDKIILRMGIVEMKYFSEIPPKVIINEAIELGKKYSTEKSNVFINGILNKLKDELRKDDLQKQQ